MASKDIDVIAVGRSSIDLYAADIGAALGDARLFQRSVGGSPTNIAVGAARLGLKSALLTRVGDDPLGRSILETLADEGVETSAIAQDPDRLTALVLLSVQDRHNSPHMFYRTECADMALTIDDVDPALIARCRSVVVTGTHFSTPAVARASWRAIDLARDHGAQVVFDIDFRPSLWGIAPKSDGTARAGTSPQVAKVLSAVAEAVDVVVGTEEEIAAVVGEQDPETALALLREKTAAHIVCKRGAYGCDIFPAGGKLSVPVQGHRFEVDVVNTIGAGDAFMAGFLRGYLQGEPLDTCATYANAAGAIAVTRLLCSQDYAYWPELQAVIDRAKAGAKGADLTTALPKPPKQVAQSLFLLACDHRSQFRDIADRLGLGYERFSDFKRLTVQAVDAVRNTHPTVGLILDAEYGTDALFDAGRLGLTAARPIEVPGSRPLAFVTGRDVGSALITWPQSQIVKCLCHYDPNDDALLGTQQDRIAQVYEACQRTGHRFLLEIIPPAGIDPRDKAVLEAIAQIYDLGVHPDYWKLEPFVDADVWRAISRLVRTRDPGCQGILVLGQERGPTELSDALRSAAMSGATGFAIGRGIVARPFEDWLTGKADDTTAVAQMRDAFLAFIETWQSARQNSKERA